MPRWVDSLPSKVQRRNTTSGCMMSRVPLVSATSTHQNDEGTSNSHSSNRYVAPDGGLIVWVFVQRRWRHTETVRVMDAPVTGWVRVSDSVASGVGSPLVSVRI